MALTKIGSIGINTGIQFAGVTTIATLNASDNVLSVGGTVNFVSDVSIGGTVSIAGTLTYEDVTNIDAVGLITARNGIVVGSGITLSKDGDIFATGVSTVTTLKVGSGVTVSSDGDVFATGVTTSTTFSGNFSGGTVSGTTGTFSGITQAAQFKLLDNAKAVYGTGADMEIYHNATNTLIQNATGTLQIVNTGSDLYQQAAGAISFNTNGSNERMNIGSNGYVNIGSGTAEEQLTIRNTTQHCLIRIISANSTGASAGIDFGDSDDTDVGRIRYYHDDGSNQNYLRFDTNGAERLRIDENGGVSMLNDNAQLRIGAGGDLQLYHDTTGTPGTVIKNTTGHLYVQSIGDVKLRTNDSEMAVDCQVNGAVHLHYDGASDSNLYTRYDGLTIRNNNVESTKDCNVDMVARVDGSAQLHMYADDNTDNNKKFQIKASNGETMDFNSYYTGGWDFHLRFSKGANNTSDRKVQVGKGGLRFDLAAEDYRDIDGDGHLFRRDGQAQVGVDDFFYIHDISTSDNNLRLRHRFDCNTGNIDAEGSINANQSLDFAEYFEWSDGNPSNEDRIGHTVSADGLTGKIKIAEEGETVIGVISGTAGYIGGGQAFSWQGRFKHDEWGREVFEEQKDENGNLIYSDAETRAQIVKTERIETVEYDPSLENSYVPRELRKEWDVVGLLGQIRVRKTAVIPSNWVKLKEIDSVKDLYLVR